jgi:AcrR family transcriptional regulator
MAGRKGVLSASDRDRLIEAAAGLCAERGYEEIDEKAITARAGLTTTAFDQHFEDKEECLAAAENAILREVVSAVSRSYSADRSEWENVIHGVKEILELMAANPEFAYLGYVFSRQMAPGSVREINETGHRMLEAMLQRGWDYSDSPHQPACAALGVLGGAQAIVRRELVTGRAWRLPQLLPDCVYIATVPFLGQGEAMRLARKASELLQDGELEVP